MPETWIMRSRLEDVSQSAITNTGVWLRELAAAVPAPAGLLAASPEEQAARGYAHTLREICQQPSPGWKRPILRWRTGNCSATRCADAAPVLHVIAGQLIGFFRSLKEGLPPDSPSVNAPSTGLSRAFESTGARRKTGHEPARLMEKRVSQRLNRTGILPLLPAMPAGGGR